MANQDSKNFVENVLDAQKQAVDTMVENTRKFTNGNAMVNDTMAKGSEWYKNWLDTQKNVFSNTTEKAGNATALDQLIEAQHVVHLLVFPGAGAIAGPWGNLRDIQRKLGIGQLAGGQDIGFGTADGRPRQLQFAVVVLPERLGFGKCQALRRLGQERGGKQQDYGEKLAHEAHRNRGVVSYGATLTND